MFPRNIATAAISALILIFGPVGLAIAEPTEDIAGEPANVGDVKTAAVAYHDSGQYEHDLAVVAAQAIDWIGLQAPITPRPAVVFDIHGNAPLDRGGIRAIRLCRFLNRPL